MLYSILFAVLGVFVAQLTNDGYVQCSSKQGKVSSNEWAEWSMCTVTCGPGTKSRDRNCTGLAEVENCNENGREPDVGNCTNTDCPKSSITTIIAWVGGGCGAVAVLIGASVALYRCCKRQPVDDSAAEEQQEEATPPEPPTLCCSCCQFDSVEFEELEELADNENQDGYYQNGDGYNENPDGYYDNEQQAEADGFSGENAQEGNEDDVARSSEPFLLNQHLEVIEDNK